MSFIFPLQSLYIPFITAIKQVIGGINSKTFGNPKNRKNRFGKPKKPIFENLKTQKTEKTDIANWPQPRQTGKPKKPIPETEKNENANVPKTQKTDMKTQKTNLVQTGFLGFQMFLS